MILKSANYSSSTINENSVAAAVTGSTHRVYRLILLNGAASAQTVSVKDKASGSTLGTFSLPSTIGGGIVLSASSSEDPLFVTVTSGALIVNQSAATLVTGYVQYTTV